jgi:DNA-binding MarR family transcriptional regulator
MCGSRVSFVLKGTVVDNLVVYYTLHIDNMDVYIAVRSNVGDMTRTKGADLALLLLSGFEAMVDEVVAGLANQGHPGTRAIHEFALRSIDLGADTASELGRRLGVSKQAAAKTIATLEELGYLERGSDPIDARIKRLSVTARGHEMMIIGAVLFDAVRERWAAEIGIHRLEAIETHLALLTERQPDGLEELTQLEEA